MVSDEQWMRRALALAHEGANQGEVPVGCVIVDRDGNLLAEAFNAPIALHDPTAHAEILAVRRATLALQNYRLPPETRMYVTLEPCGMCAGAIANARVERLFFGAVDRKGGAVVSGVRAFDQPTCHWRPAIEGGLLGEPSADLLRAFFRARRG
jgi:tRNA(adenine34) deaminase